MDFIIFWNKILKYLKPFSFHESWLKINQRKKKKVMVWKSCYRQYFFIWPWSMTLTYDLVIRCKCSVDWYFSNLCLDLVSYLSKLSSILGAGICGSIFSISARNKGKLAKKYKKNQCRNKLLKRKRGHLCTLSGILTY